MLADIINNPLMILMWFGALVVAITFHEFAHAYMADRLGDPTPRLMGRLTLNPRAHLDPIGTLMILFVRFGWGKPVQFDPFNLKDPRRDGAIISLAGPASNLLLATVASVLLRLILTVPFLGAVAGVSTLLAAFLQVLVVLNVTLAVFNLVPVHPLDGFKIVAGILPEEYARQWKDLEPYGLLFLFLLVFPILGRTAPISWIMNVPVQMILRILLPFQGFV